MKKITLLLIIIFISLNSGLWAQSNLPLHLKIMSLAKPEEPQIWNDRIFLTARPKDAVRFVGVAFDFESYNIIHSFEINEKGIYVFSAPTPEEANIHYRLIIDGLWMADPLCPDNIKDEYGIEVSMLKNPSSSYLKVKGPEQTDRGSTVFTIRTRPNATVSIVGTFNGWDPYMTPLKEISSGVYRTEIKLHDGSYFYYFIVDGKKTMDPINFGRARNVEGEEVCRIDIGI